jgi:hypothetical protein
MSNIKCLVLIVIIFLVVNCGLSNEKIHDICTSWRKGQSYGMGTAL